MRQMALFLIGLFFGGGLGFLIAASQGITLDGHDHADPAQHAAADHDGHGDHAPVDLPANAQAPTLGASLARDATGGWNLQIVTTNFRFAPENVNGANVAGQGHAHVYVNGAKIARLYGPWMHLDTLPAGAVLGVTLTANDHSPLSVGGNLLRLDITVPDE